MSTVGAFLRLKDEAMFLDYCLQSIVEHFDQIVLCTQGEQQDNTIEICERWADRWEHITHHHYPYDSVPNGPDYGDEVKKHCETKSRAYFYNWCLEKLTTDWKCKWDGDMVMLDAGMPVLDDSGTEMATGGWDMAGDLEHTNGEYFIEVRFFKEGYYIDGQYCEQFARRLPRAGEATKHDCFIHLKWLKPEYSITKAWPENWRQIDHFQRIWERRLPKKPYEGELPSCLKNVDGIGSLVK